MHKFSECRGSTLIELIIGFLILTFSLLSLIYLFMSLGVGNADGQARAGATTLAQELTEDIKSKRFDERTSKDLTGNWSTTLGVDSGETATDRSTFDDADDYNGFSESLSSPYTGFSRSVAVAYVGTSPGYDLTVTAPSGTTTDYKRITVSVTKGSTTYSQMVSIVSPGRSQDN